MRATLIYGAGDERLEQVPDGYPEMAGRDALKVLIRP